MKTISTISILLLFILILSNSKSNAQVDTNIITYKKVDEISGKQEFKKILNLHFSKIITGNTYTSFGNYVSVSSTSESLKLSGSIINDKRNLITVEASGGASEGIAGFFTNGKLNSNYSGKISYHILINPLSTNSISRNSYERDIIQEELNKENTEFYKRMVKNETRKEYLDNIYTLNKNLVKKDTIKSLLERYNNKFDDLIDAKDTLKISIIYYKRDSLTYELKNIEYDIDILEQNISQMEEEGYFEEQEERLREEYENAVKKINNKIYSQAIKSINIYWMSISGGFRNNDFKLLNKDTLYANQIEKINYTNLQFNLSLSRYVWESFSSKDIYWSFGLNYEFGNSISSLSSVSVKDIDTVFSNNNREFFTSQKVLEGEYMKDIHKLILYYNRYKFFRKNSDLNNSFAFHLNPKLHIEENAKPVSSLQIGILFPFKKITNQSSIINLEVFYRLKDIFNTSKNKNSLLNRNTIGLLASFPINFYEPK